MKYEIIYADFPWPYTSFGTAKLPYKCMEEEEIAEFDWSRFLAKRAIVFSWVTSAKADVAFRCGERWRARHGLHFSGIPYIWVKTKEDGAPIGAAGPRPRLVKPLDEYVVAYSTTPKSRTFPLLTESQVQHQFAPKVPRGQHSRKPALFRDLIVELLGDRPRIELFARERVAGWDGWGDEYPEKEE
jgi:site-specific DNA-methyltransferase (adenine-specific)